MRDIVIPVVEGLELRGCSRALGSKYYPIARPEADKLPTAREGEPEGYNRFRACSRRCKLASLGWAVPSQCKLSFQTRATSS